MKPTTIANTQSLITTIDELGIPFAQMCEELCGVIWDRDARRFEDMAMDELDVITVILEVEKSFGLEITDGLLEDLITSTRPNDLVVVAERRRRLDELGI